VAPSNGMGAIEEDLIQTEDLFLVSSQQHARLLRLQNRTVKDQKFQQNSVNKVKFCGLNLFLSHFPLASSRSSRNRPEFFS
jgi:hypothetical protein